MKAFQFRLQAVLTLREQAEQAAQQSCALAYAAVSTAATRVQVVEAAIAASDESRRVQLTAGTRADQLEQLRTFAVLLAEQQIGRMRELTKARLEAEAAWSFLLLATQRREALERLRQRQQSLHAHEAARTEQKNLDELAGHGRTLAEAWRETAVNV